MKTWMIWLLYLTPSYTFATQSSDDDPLFLKRIENNYINDIVVELPNGKQDGMYNIRSKQGVEKLFFGDFNAKVEYFFYPSFDPVSGFRIYRDSLDKTYLLEIKQTTKKIGLQTITDSEILSEIIPVSDAFVEKVYATTVKKIDNFTVTGKPSVPFDGYTATFRCVVDAEVWTLTLKVPSGEFKTLSDLFRAMIADVEAGKFDEVKYIEALN